MGSPKETAQLSEESNPVRERTIVLARHAETELNVQKRLRGRADPPLSPRGVGQAEALAAWLDGQAPTSLFSSPRRRASETADAIARRHSIATVVDARLDDVDYGEWTACTEEELRAKWPAQYEQYLRKPESVTFPGGEAVLSVEARAWQIVTEMAASWPSERIVLVTHDAILRMIVCHLLGLPLARMHELTFDVASTTGLEVHGGVPKMKWMNNSSQHGQQRRSE